MESSRRDSRSASPGQRRKTACQFCYQRKMKCDMLEPACTNCVNAKKNCSAMERIKRPRPTNERIDALEEENHDLRAYLVYLSGCQSDQAMESLLVWRTTGKTNRSTSQTLMGTHEINHASTPPPPLQPPQTPHDLSNASRRISTNISEIIPMQHGRHQPPYASTPHQMENASHAIGSNAVASGSTSRPVSPGVPTRSQSRIQYSTNGYASAHGPTSAFFDDRDDNESQRGYYNQQQHQGQELSEAELRDAATSECAEQRHKEIMNAAAGRLDCDGVPPDLAMHLLALHWNRQHFAFLISYRPLFMRDMACGGPYFSHLLLNAIFFSVSKFSDRIEVYDDPTNQKTAGQRFLRRIKALLGEALDQSTIPTIQAMLLLSSSLFALGYQSAAWLYSGIAIRMIFDLGLHHDSLGRSPALPAEEVEIRRRVVWSAFVLDKIISLYQGRAISFDDSDMHVPHRFLDRYEEQELWTPFAFGGLKRYPGAPARAISTFTCLCSLSVVMGRIITKIYVERTQERPAEHLKRLSANLDKWFASVPDEIRFDASSETSQVPPPHVLSLYSVYYTLVTLLHRPFVESGHHVTADPSIVQLSWSRCESAAKSATMVVSRYRETFTLSRAPYLISYTIYVAATIHARIAAQQGPNSEANRQLAICLAGLEENAATNPGVQRMLVIIQQLMTRLGVSVMESHTTMPDPPVFEGLDISAIVRSFGYDPIMDGTTFAFPPHDQTMYQSADNGADQQEADSLYGIWHAM